MKKISCRLGWAGFLSMIIALMSACAAMFEYGKLERSARAAYQSGDYDQAFYSCAQSLQLKPEYAKAQDLIQDAFKKAVETHQDKIKELENGNEKLKWDAVVTEYEALGNINKVVKTLPTLRREETGQEIKFDTHDYSQELSDAKLKAAEVHYQAGVRLSKKATDVDTQKLAAKEFKAASHFVPSYKDSDQLYEQAHNQGIKRIAVIPFVDKSNKGGQYGGISDMIVDNIVAQVTQDPEASEFLAIVSREQLEQVLREQKLGMGDIIDEQTAIQAGKVLGVHEIVTGKITTISVNPGRQTDRRETKTAQVCLVDGDKGCLQWGNVSATVFIHTLEANATINGSYNIIDVKTARQKVNQALNGAYRFSNQWGEYQGDQRAVQGLALGPQQSPPVEQDMVNSAATNLANQLARSFKAYVR